MAREGLECVGDLVRVRLAGLVMPDSLRFSRRRRRFPFGTTLGFLKDARSL